ncbi:hypothetical protein SAMN05421676_105271 [Salinibacillus kushneri]|uniref:YkoP-like domain-containing protein n=1 Tax=Salinibacillus kushneri TaxID=237682 RepID=A0A1I0FB15_9BACI|nr:hypothetical protein [Salinibacillus kushneri]SET55408.1 hypothetical protein SAMN05421676_105271 [Salinibacillus kushneri]
MRKLMLWLWLYLDPVYFRFTRLHYIGKYHGSTSNIFRVRLTRFKGSPLTLSDGTIINKNDLLLKIHLHNVRLLHELQDETSEIKKAFFAFERVKDSMPGLATYVLTHKRHHDIKAVIGITSLNKGVSRLGFETRNIQSPIYKWVKKMTFYPIHILSLSKPSLKTMVNQPLPNYILMSKNQLLSSYIHRPLEKVMKKRKQTAKRSTS